MTWTNEEPDCGGGGGGESYQPPYNDMLPAPGTPTGMSFSIGGGGGNGRGSSPASPRGSGPSGMAGMGSTMSAAEREALVAKAEAATAAKAKQPRSVGGSNRGKNPPHPDAQGPHTTFKRDPQTGEVVKYDTYERPRDARNPNPWERTKSYQKNGDAHFNKSTQQYVPTPHVQGPDIPGGVRTPHTWEIPWRPAK